MRLDELARPFRREQVGEALRRVFRLHQRRVVGDHRQKDAPGGVHAVRILVGGRVVLRHVLRLDRVEQPITLPHQEMRRVGGIDRVDRIDLRGILLAYALENALGAGTLDLDLDRLVLRLERLGDRLGELQLDGRVVDDLAFLRRRRHQFGRDRSRRGRGRPHGDARQCGGRNGPARQPQCRPAIELGPARHGVLLAFAAVVPPLDLQRASPRQRSGGRWSQALAPGGTLTTGEAAIRTSVSSASATR